MRVHLPLAPYDWLRGAESGRLEGCRRLPGNVRWDTGMNWGMARFVSLPLFASVYPSVSLWLGLCSRERGTLFVVVVSGDV